MSMKLTCVFLYFCDHRVLMGASVSVEDSPGGGDNLTPSPVDGVRVQRHVVDVEPDSPQVFVTQHTLLGGPLETGHNAVLDLVQVLHSLEQSIIGLGPLV